MIELVLAGWTPPDAATVRDGGRHLILASAAQVREILTATGQDRTGKSRFGILCRRSLGAEITLGPGMPGWDADDLLRGLLDVLAELALVRSPDYAGIRLDGVRVLRGSEPGTVVTLADLGRRKLPPRNNGPTIRTGKVTEFR